MTPLFNPADLNLLVPEIIITITGLLVLVLDFAVRSRDRGWLGGLSVLGVVIALAAVIRQAATGPSRILAFSGLHVVDDYASFFKVVFLVSTIIVLLLAGRHLRDQGVELGEFYALLLFATLGTRSEEHTSELQSPTNL